MELRYYVRDEHGHPLGVLVSNSKNSVGWALCARSHGDVFNRERGVEIARGREAKGASIEKVPHSILSAFEKMLERSKKYFK